MLNLGSVYNQFKFCCIACTLGQNKTNAPGTAKVQGSNLTGPVFSKGSTPKNHRRRTIVCLCFAGLVGVL